MAVLLQKLQSNCFDNFSLARYNPLFASPGAQADGEAGVVEFDGFQDSSSATSPFSVGTAKIIGDTEADIISPLEGDDKMSEEKVETESAECIGNNCVGNNCKKEEDVIKVDEGDNIRKKQQSIRKPLAIQKIASICIESKRPPDRQINFPHCQQPHTKPHQLAHYMPSSRLLSHNHHHSKRHPRTSIDFPNVIDNAYSCPSDKSAPSSIRGSAIIDSGTGGSSNPTDIPKSMKTDPGYIGTLPPLIQHCQSYDSVTELMARKFNSMSVAQSGVELPPKGTSTERERNQPLLPFPNLVNMSGPGAEAEKNLEDEARVEAEVETVRGAVSSLTNLNPTSQEFAEGIIRDTVQKISTADNSVSSCDCSDSHCPVIAEEGTTSSESGKRESEWDIEVILKDGVRDLFMKLPMSADIAAEHTSLAQASSLSDSMTAESVTSFPNLSISIPKDVYIAPTQTPDTCPLRRVVSTCSLYDCFDEAGRQIGCDRDGNPIMDTEGNLRSLSSISFPRHTPQGYTPRHSPGGTAARNSSPPNSPKDIFCRAFSPSVVSAVIHSSPRLEMPNGFVTYNGTSQYSSRDGSGKSITTSPTCHYNNYNHYDSNCNSNYNFHNSSFNSNNNSSNNSSNNLHSNFSNLFSSNFNDHNNSTYGSSKNGDDSCTSPEYIGFSLYRNCEDFDDNFVGLPSILSGSRSSSVTDSMFVDSDYYLTPPESPHRDIDSYMEGDNSIVGFRRIDSIAELTETDMAESCLGGGCQKF